MKAIPVLLCALLGSLVLVGGIQAKTSKAAGVSCHRINAKGVGQDLGGGNTTANIIGGGLLQGTTAAHFDIVGFSPPVATIAGTVKFTTNQATLTVALSGTFNVATGSFSATGPVTGATGKLAGATGSLSFAGVEDLSTGSFTETIDGSICVDLAP